MKPTDLWGHFPKGWTPRPRIGGSDIPMDPTRDILYGSNILYQDHPDARDKRTLDAHEILHHLEQGGNVDWMERGSNAPELGMLAGGHPNAAHTFGLRGLSPEELEAY